MNQNAVINQRLKEGTAKLVSVVFYNKAKVAYTYATSILDLTFGDLAVVPVGSEFKVVEVISGDVTPELQDDIYYRWIVAKLDLTEHVNNVALNNRIAEDLNDNNKAEIS
jgi:hypothetical protein